MARLGNTFPRIVTLLPLRMTFSPPEKKKGQLNLEVNSSRLVKTFQWVIKHNNTRARLPIVFFKKIGEFRDSEPLGWLKSFLSPMQDGTFFNPKPKNRGIKKLGHAIFMFVKSSF